MSSLGEIKSVSITANGVKTRKQLCREIADSFSQIVSSAPSSHKFIILNATLPHPLIPSFYKEYIGGSAINESIIFHVLSPYITTTYNLPAYSGFMVSISTTVVNKDILYFYYTEVNGQTSTVSDTGESVPESGTIISIKYQEYISI